MPLVPTVLVKTDSQLVAAASKLVAATIRQVMFCWPLSVKRKPFVVGSICFGITVKVGNWNGTDETVTTKLPTALNAGKLVSVATTEIVKFAGACAAVGVHVSLPVLVLIITPAGVELLVWKV